MFHKLRLRCNQNKNYLQVMLYILFYKEKLIKYEISKVLYKGNTRHYTKNIHQFNYICSQHENRSWMNDIKMIIINKDVKYKI